MKLPYQSRDASEHAGMAEPRIHGPVGGNQLLPHLRRDDLHLLGQRQAAVLPEQLARALLQAMRPHHVRERLLDQRIAVNQRAVEVEDQDPWMAIVAGGGRPGSKKRLWFGCHVLSTSLG